MPDDDFDRTVSGEQWIGVSEAVINQNKDELVSQLQEINNIVENQRLVDSEYSVFYPRPHLQKL